MGQLYFDEGFCGVMFKVLLNLGNVGSERAAHKLSCCLSFSNVFSNKMEHPPHPHSPRQQSIGIQRQVKAWCIFEISSPWQSSALCVNESWGNMELHLYEPIKDLGESR